MDRLFDAGTQEKQKTAAAQRRNEVRERVEEAEKALRDAGYLDDKADELGQRLASASAAQDTSAVQAIRYKQHRPAGSRWLIEHTQVGDDYVFQLFPLRPPAGTWQDVIGHMIGAMDVIFPRSVQIKYTPPDENFQMKFYTIRVTELAKVPGWGGALERTLASLTAMNVWS